MFVVKDANGQQIYLRDTVSYEAVVDDMGLLDTEEGQVLLLPEEGMVQVQPLKKGGTPFMIESEKLTVTYSLVASVANLSNHAELQEMVLNAEKRYEGAVQDEKDKKKRKPRTSGGSSTPKAKKTNVDLGDLF